jgi:hypothetical protein
LSLAYGSSHMIRAVTVGEQLFDAAEKIGERGNRVLASWLLGMALTGRGRLERALETLEHGLALTDAAEDAAQADHYSSDPRIAVLAYKALVLHQLGFADRAAAVDATSVADAVRGGHSATIGLALTLRLSLQLLRCDHGGLAVTAAELGAHAERQASKPLQAVSGAVLGLLRLEGQPDEQLFGRVHQTIDAIRAAGWNLMVGWLSLLEAKICLAHGRLADAKNTLGALQDVIEPRGHDFFLPELYRLHAQLLAQQGANECIVEDRLQRARELSVGQHARFAELRAATDLARRWHAGGRRREALALIEPLVGWFGEGSECFDLKQAGEVLSALRSTD